MPQLPLDTGDCDSSRMDFHCPDDSPQVDSCLGYFGTLPPVEGTDDPTFNSNGCGSHHNFGPHNCNEDLQVRANILSRRSHEGDLHAMPGIDREKDLHGQTLGTEVVATGDDSFDDPNTERSTSPRLIYTKRRKSGVGDQNPLPGGHDSTDDLSKQSPAQGNGNNGNGPGNGGANGNGNGNGSNQNNGNGNGNGGGPGNGNGNGNNSGNGNGNGAGNSPGNPPSGGTTSSTGSGGGLPTTTSNNVGPTSGASAPSTSSPPVPTQTSNGSGSSGINTSANQSNSAGNPASTTNQNDRPTTPADAAPTTQASTIASQLPQGSTDPGSSGVIEVWSTISTVSTFTSTGVAVVTFTSGSSVLTTTRPTTSIGVTTLSIPTTVSVPANDTQPHSNSKVGSIVGAVIGSILGCILLLVMLLWFRRRQRRRNKVGFFYLTPGPGQRDAELSNPPRMSQATDLQAGRARASTSPFPSVLSLPSLIDLNRSRTPTTDGLAGSPYELLPRASSNSYLGRHDNNSSIDYPHPENPFVDPPPPPNENTIDTTEMVPMGSSNPFE